MPVRLGYSGIAETTTTAYMKKYMVVECIKDGQYDAVYDRFDKQGRMLPDGLSYLESWTSREKNVCYQLMETDSESLFDEWVSRWSDLVDLEIVPLD